MMNPYAQFITSPSVPLLTRASVVCVMGKRQGGNEVKLYGEHLDLPGLQIVWRWVNPKYQRQVVWILFKSC